MTAQELVKHQESSPANREETRTSGRVLIPAVDIFESEDNLTVVADLPGVRRDGLEINLERGVLTISGAVNLQPRGKAVLREFSRASYYRQFRLSEHIDADKSEAELKNGVLTLVIPKAESAKPRKIAIRQ